MQSTGSSVAGCSGAAVVEGVVVDGAVDVVTGVVVDEGGGGAAVVDDVVLVVCVVLVTVAARVEDAVEGVARSVVVESVDEVDDAVAVELVELLLVGRGVLSLHADRASPVTAMAARAAVVSLLFIVPPVMTTCPVTEARPGRLRGGGEQSAEVYDSPSPNPPPKGPERRSERMTPRPVAAPYLDPTSVAKGSVRET